MWTIGCSELAEVPEAPAAYNPDSTSCPPLSLRERFVWISVVEIVCLSRQRPVSAGELVGV